MAAVNIENVKKPVAALYPSDVGLRCVEVYIPDHDGYLWILAAFVAILGNDWAWLGTKTDRQTRAQLWQTAYAATLWDMCMKCEELQECLQPFFDAISVRFDTIDAVQQQILDRINESQTVQPPQPVEIDDCDEGKAYNGTLQAVDQVNLLITGIYKRAEVEAPDNFAEAVELLISAVPIFETLPMDELFSLTQWVFDNQRALYDASFVEEIEGHYWFEHAAGQLWCLVKDDCVLDHEKIGMWLSSLADLYPENYAAEIFAKFGNATDPTMVNQIGELLNSLRGGQSLAGFFDDIIIQFGVGAQTSNPDYLWIDCPEPWEWVFPTDESFEAFTLLEYAGATCVIEDDEIHAVEDVPATNNMFSNFEIVVDGNISGIEVLFSANVDIDATYEYRLYIDEELQASQMYESDGDYILIWEGDLTGEHTYRFLTGARGNPADGDFIKTTEVAFSGVGVNPFEP